MADFILKPTAGTGNKLILQNEAGNAILTTGNNATDSIFPAGHILQVQNVQTGAVATGTTTSPGDDTIPQITEGDEYMTLAITPKNASNILLINVDIGLLASSASNTITVALHEGTTANALAATLMYQGSAADTRHSTSLMHKMVAGSASELTFRVRAGASGAGTTTFNGHDGNRKLGGVCASSITIMEIQV